MYRPAVNPGYDAIGAAIAGGLADARASLRRNREEDEERRRYNEERARQKRLDQIAETERQRRIQLENIQLGVIDPNDPILRATIPQISTQPTGFGVELPDVMPEPAVTGPVSTGPTREPLLRPGTVVQGPPQASANPDILRFGDLAIDPRLSLAYRTQRITREDERKERDELLEQTADRIQQLDPTISRGEAIARAAGINIADPITRAQALGYRREDLELMDEFQKRAEERQFAHDRAMASFRASLGGGGGAGGMPATRQRNAVEGMALTLADEISRNPNLLVQEGVVNGRRVRAVTDPIKYIRGRVRVAAQQNGITLTEPELQELVVRSWYYVQDQSRQHMYAPRDPNASLTYEFDPIGGAVRPDAIPGVPQIPNGPAGGGTVTRTIQPGPTQAQRQGGQTGGATRIVGRGIVQETRTAIRAGSSEAEIRQALAARNYTQSQINDILSQARSNR